MVIRTSILFSLYGANRFDQIAALVIGCWVILSGLVNIRTGVQSADTFGLALRQFGSVGSKDRSHGINRHGSERVLMYCVLAV
jgi:hypothetical protein